MTVLAPGQWRQRQAAHERRVDEWIRPHLHRRRAGQGHPVEDFLFTYYSHSPGRLRRWHPGAGVVLAGGSPDGRFYRTVGPPIASGDATAVTAVTAITVDTDGLLARRRPSVAAIRRLLAATARRPAYLGCFGVHEWAMVYGLAPGEIRHTGVPLRLPPERIAGQVEAREVRCSHYDAFRFFTAPARPLNVLQPDRDSPPELEQPGCLHANMDLYKWAYKLSPLIRSELVADCFELARDIRAVDMRASPYDLSSFGYEPIRVELPEGRAEYAAAQRAFAERAEPLRRELIAECDRLLAMPGESGYAESQGVYYGRANGPRSRSAGEAGR